MRKEICVVAQNSFGAMQGGGTNGHVGGVEKQTSILCRWFANNGYQVSLLTWDEGQDDDLVIDRVRIIKLCKKNDGIHGFRFFYPRWSSLMKAMNMADAAVYYQNCAEYVTGQIALWCQQKKRSFIYSVASDPDCDRNLPTMETFRERSLYRYGIMKADRVIVQTRAQQKMIKEGFGRESLVLPMPCLIPEEFGNNHRFSVDLASPRILWVGRIVPVKRLEILLDIAEELPQLSFDIAGGSDSDDRYALELFARGKNIFNITFHGKVAWHKIGELYRKASLLCCTSLYEGFPNTFLEAWSHGVPVVSTVDPDGLISENGLGAAVFPPGNLADAIRGLLSDPERWEQSSKNASRYFLENHALEPAMRRFERVFLEVMG